MNWTERLFAEMPKAEPHLHLDGSLRVGTAAALLGAPYEAVHRRLVLPAPVRSQRELLGYFTLPCALLQTEAALARAARELVEDKAADHVRYCEIRWAPALHTQKGLTVRQVVAAVAQGVREGCARTGVVARLIAVGMRTHPLAVNLAMLEALPEFMDIVAGADFAGLEDEAPDATAQRAYFLRARELGLFVTLHCGETEDQGAARLLAAVRALAPQRVAHGPEAACSREAMALLKENGVCLDLCPASNVQAGLFASYAQFPLEALYRAGVPVTLNTDDPVLSNVTLSEEYARVYAAGTLTPRELFDINKNALRHAFLPEGEKTRLLAEFDAFAVGIEELRA